MGSFYRHVARVILSRHEPPDLRTATVLLPNYHAVEPLARALCEQAGQLLLPQMITLADWAKTVVIDASIQPDSLRLATLYQALREREWFNDADLWSLSRELLALMDELTRHHVALPESAEEFARQLTLAYQAKSGAAMQFEARVVHALWYAMSCGDELDDTRAYQLRLGMLAARVKNPLYVLQTCDFSAPEKLFLDACSAQVFDLRVMVADLPDFSLLTCALQLQHADLLGMAEELKEGVFWHQRLRLFGAHGLEQEAQAADVQVRRWLIEEKKSIAVVVQDRLVARRLRALLERAQVQVQDETGWTFSTLSVSTVLMNWLEVVQGDFYYQDVLDLLKSPYLFSENPVLRKLSSSRFEALVRKHGIVAHLQDYLSVAERTEPELVLPLARMRQAARLLEVKSATLCGWLTALHESLETLGVVQGWQQDAAGQQLMQLLLLWRQELQADQTVCSFSQWRRWLSQQLDLNTYRDVSVESPVLFTHLSATRWRRFDAVLLIGCDAAHLPAPVNAGQWFNDAVRATLGLPLSGLQQAQVRDDLLCLLALNDNVLATWQASQNGEPNLLSPHLEMLRALHLLAFEHDLMDSELAGLVETAQVRMQDVDRKGAPRTTGEFCSKLLREGFGIQDSGFRSEDASMPRPVVPAELLPTRISPSGYNSLMSCPYQYFARHVLHLNEPDEVREELDKRDYGIWVHEILQRFHARMPVLGPDAESLLRQISAEVFAVGHDYLARAWLLRWQALIPAYLQWQHDHECSGWRHQRSEAVFELQVDGDLQLFGRLDRVDVGKSGELSVLDYKTQSAGALKSRLKAPGEDVQLACYAALVNADSAAFVSLDGDIVQTVMPKDNILSEENIARLRALFTQMRGGAGMPAHGVRCEHCEMRGLCRRGEWEERQDQGSRPQGSSHETTELKLLFLSEGCGIQETANGKLQTVNGFSHG